MKLADLPQGLQGLVQALDWERQQQSAAEDPLLGVFLRFARPKKQAAFVPDGRFKERGLAANGGRPASPPVESVEERLEAAP